MAKNITLMGADYPDVPAVQLPKTGGGTATFYDMDEAYKGNYFCSPVAEYDGLYFATCNFRNLAPDTNYTVTLVDMQGGGNVTQGDFTITKYTHGFRAYTTKATYLQRIINATVS